MQPQEEPNYWQAANETVPVIDTPVPAGALPTDLQETSLPVPGPISWQASEFIHHEKDGTWFVALMGVALVLLLVDFFFVKSWTFGALIIVMAIAAIVVGKRPPRTLTYILSLQGVKIDEKLFSFHDFRAFGVVQEEAFYSVRLVPNKRFMPMVSIYFPPEHGEQIVDMLGSMLPMETIELDMIDKLTEKIRF